MLCNPKTPTYEDMILLSSLIGPAKPIVASNEEIDSAGGLVTASLLQSASEFDQTNIYHVGAGERCLVCLCDFEEGEACRQLLTCKHTFHRACIDEVSKKTCNGSLARHVQCESSSANLRLWAGPCCSGSRLGGIPALSVGLGESNPCQLKYRKQDNVDICFPYPLPPPRFGTCYSGFSCVCSLISELFCSVSSQTWLHTSCFNR